MQVNQKKANKKGIVNKLYALKISTTRLFKFKNINPELAVDIPDEFNGTPILLKRWT